MVEPKRLDIPISRQCELVGLPRSTYYFQPQAESDRNLRLMQKIDELYMEHPFYGCRKMGQVLGIDKDHANRLMRKMGIEAIYPKPKITRANVENEVFPYLLRNVKIDRPNQVWSTDITYIPMARGFVYLTAVIDWFSRFVLSWRLSNTLDSQFCAEALELALSQGQRPEIFNTDQGSQFTSNIFTSILKANGITISMDGRGRALDNVFIERLWRTVKYEEIYLNSYADIWEIEERLRSYFDFYCCRRPHQALAYRTPAQVYAS